MGYPFTRLGSYGKIVDTSHVDNYLAIPLTSIFSIPAEICEIAPIAMRIWQVAIFYTGPRRYLFTIAEALSCVVP